VQAAHVFKAQLRHGPVEQLGQSAHHPTRLCSIHPAVSGQQTRHALGQHLVGVTALFELLRLGVVGQQVGQVFARVIALGHMGKTGAGLGLPGLDKQGDE
jgi:hypothetical protein